MSTTEPKTKTVAKAKTREGGLTTPVTSKAAHLPSQGMSRVKDILPFLPFGKTTLSKWVKDGRFPKPVKITDKVVAWHNSEVIAWLENATGIDRPSKKITRIDTVAK